MPADARHTVAWDTHGVVLTPAMVHRLVLSPEDRLGTVSCAKDPGVAPGQAGGRRRAPELCCRCCDTPSFTHPPTKALVSYVKHKVCTQSECTISSKFVPWTYS